MLRVISEEFLDQPWSPETQNALLTKLKERGIVDPYNASGTFMDKAALTRIWKKLLETLGLLYVKDDKGIVVTAAGSRLLSAKKNGQQLRPIVEGQIAKLQYPNPTIAASYRNEFVGILPHLFLLQVLSKCGYKISVQEFELFVNLAKDQVDVERISSYILAWRELSEAERDTLLGVVRLVPAPGRGRKSGAGTRYQRILNDSAYQRAVLTYPNYLGLDDKDGIKYLVCHRPDEVQAIVTERLKDLKISHFDTLEGWLAYYGDPAQEPTWFTYLAQQIELAKTPKQAKDIVKTHKVEFERQLTAEEKQEIERKQDEKEIENFYVRQLHRIEPGLRLAPNGQQFDTPIGRMDLLCRSASGEYVVVEVKAGDAEDSVFGQILRYIGWVHMNLPNGRDNVRGIILAKDFAETARYSRIGLLKSNHKTHIGFMKHGLDLQNI